MRQNEIDNKVFDNYIHYQYNRSEDISSGTRLMEKLKSKYYYLDKAIGNYFNDDNLNILDIGFGYWGFTYFCEKKGMINYCGIDISKEEYHIVSKLFPRYNFKVVDVFDFLKDNTEKYDVVFMSHVLEHLNLEDQIKLIELIKKNLSKEGIYINMMPNGSSYFSLGLCADITHKWIHSPKSFNQVLLLARFEDFEHKNDWVGRNIFERIIHRIFIGIFHLIVRSLGYDKQEIYTSSIITICRNC